MKLYFKIKSIYSYEKIGTKLEKEYYECGSYYEYCFDCGNYHSFPKYKTIFIKKDEYQYIDKSFYHVCTFRSDPIPDTGKNKQRCYRHPKTTQERRWSEANKEFTRGKRNLKNLCTSFDDIIRSDYRNHSWKNKKIKKQWMKNK